MPSKRVRSRAPTIVSSGGPVSTPSTVTTQYSTANFTTVMAYLASSAADCRTVGDVMTKGAAPIQTVAYSLAGFTFSTVVDTNTVGIGGPQWVECDSTAGAFTLSIPSAGNYAAGAEVVLHKSSSDANTVTLSTSSSIDGIVADGKLFAKGDQLGLVSDGTNWRISRIIASPVRLTATNAAWAIPAGWGRRSPPKPSALVRRVAAAVPPH